MFPKMDSLLVEMCEHELNMRHVEDRPSLLDFRQDSVWKAA